MTFVPPSIRALLRRTPIRWLMLGYYLMILLITLAMLSLGIYYSLGRFLWHSNEARLRSVVETGWYADNGDDEPRNHLHGRGLPAPQDFPAHSDDLARRMSGRGVYVRILDATGRVLAESGHSSHPPPVELEMLKRVRELEPGRLTYLAGGAREWQVMLIPIIDGDGLVGAVQICGQYHPARELLAALAGYLLLGGALAALLAVAVTFLLARFLAFPMERMLSATRRVRQGDLSARTGLSDGNNEIYAVAGAFDEMVEQLQETFNAQRRFVADASHELKTPLTAIGGMAEILRVGADRGKPEQRELALATIEKEVDRMSALVSDLLTLSSSEQARPSALTEIDLVPLVGEMVAQRQLLAADYKIEQALTPPLKVMGDPEQLIRILGNLLDNALKYSAPGSCVRIQAKREGEWARLDVIDQGIGIAADDLVHVFDRFYRADHSRARKTGGSGLGLAIVRTLVELQGGKISATSQPHHGSTFTLHLMAAQS